MIKNISPGTGLTINGGQASWPSFYNTPSSNSLVGQMRYNGSNQCIEVYDGNSWLILGNSYPTIELAPHVQAVVQWAQIKMAEESRLKELAQKHPTVADALAAVTKAEEQLRIVTALVDTA